MNHNDYLDANFRIFPLWGKKSDDSCACGDPECEAVLKHPRISNWQHSPHWSEEQIEVMEMSGQLSTGFGACVDNHLIIDVDPRNGGFESYELLKKALDIDFEDKSAFVVNTGGGGLHIYFKAPEGVALSSHLKQYVGIDFKSSGYVVGCGSLHASGAIYEKKKGHPCDIAENNPAPEVLISLLKKPDRIRAAISDSEFMDVSEDEIRGMLNAIDPDYDYDTWCSIGMGIHDATSGSDSGFLLWDSWSQNGNKYKSDEMDKKWHSFGKCVNPITLGTVIYHAEQGGWHRPVDFTMPVADQHESAKHELPFPIDSVDLLRPCGFVGQVTQWINDQCRYPRERLAVATAFNVVGNLVGLRHKDTYNDITANTMMLCVAGSGTGKEAVTQAGAEIMRVAKISAAVHGAIKSEQEIVRNVVRHQASFYVIDELGYLLQKIENARKKGGASYLDSVIGQLMSIYTKANGFYLIGGDLKDAVRDDMLKELSKLTKRLDSGECQDSLKTLLEERISHISTKVIPSIENGIEGPFLSLLGYTTPVSFDDLVTGEQATNGFISRCLLIREHETNPKRRKSFKPRPMDDTMKARIKLLQAGGVTPYDDVWRVEYTGHKVDVHTTPEAAEMLEACADWFEREGDKQKEITGLEAIIRRGYEATAKLSFIMACSDERLRTPVHVRYAFAFVISDMREKLRLAQTNILSSSKNAQDSATVLRNSIITAAGEDGEPLSVIKRRMKSKFDPRDIEAMLSQMVESGHIEEIRRETGGRPSVRYKSKR